RAGTHERTLCPRTPSSSDRSLDLTTNPAREGLTPVLSPTRDFAEDASQSPRGSKRGQSFVVNVVGSSNEGDEQRMGRRRVCIRAGRRRRGRFPVHRTASVPGLHAASAERTILGLENV